MTYGNSAIALGRVRLMSKQTNALPAVLSKGNDMYSDAARGWLNPATRHRMPMLSDTDLRLAILVGSIGAGCTALTTDDPPIVTFGSREDGVNFDIRVECHRSEDHVELVLEAEGSIQENFEVVAEVSERLMLSILTAADQFASQRPA